MSGPGRLSLREEGRISLIRNRLFGDVTPASPAALLRAIRSSAILPLQTQEGIEMKKLGAWMGTAAAVLTAFLSVSSASAQSPVDSNLPVYRPVDSLTGEITIAGSNDMAQMAAQWADAFTRFYPKVKVNLASVSSTKSVEMVQGKQADFALMSRDMLPEEVASFKKAAGHDPTLFVSCVERIAVMVNSNNPVESVTLADLDAIFSSTNKHGEKAPTSWGQLGVSGTLASQPIHVVVREEPTGPPATFAQIVMLGGDFKKDVSLQDSYVNVAKTVAKEPGAISFAGSMYMLRGTKSVAIAAEKGQPAVAIDSKEADAGLYPLVRPLTMVANYDQKTALNDVQKEFIKYVFSQSGQEDVIKSGFDPITAAPAKVALEAVGLHSLN
jgi:phosphate transport system substrate-binding protein